ncbi:MAG: hypothetical protein B7X45_13160 [Lysobacterales bacterium 15-68-25]|jgi:uncharacterized membrane protein|nr:MAG: hypothetical protein B7X45_13160 [Xanthomonadales bacterium 15-68-25]
MLKVIKQIGEALLYLVMIIVGGTVIDLAFGYILGYVPIWIIVGFFIVLVIYLNRPSPYRPRRE